MKFTQQDRLKAISARKAVIANNPFRKDWLDGLFLEFLASKRKIRLPQWHIPPTTRKLKRWHESLDKESFEEVYGCKPKRLIDLNPRMSLRAFVGVMLERSFDGR